MLDVDLQQVPTSPGCYQFFSVDGTALYVGKAINLRRRLADHLQQPIPKIKRMLVEAYDLQWIVCSNELEALLVEAGLIGRLQPRYNSRLKTSNPYPSLAIDSRYKAPRLVKWRYGQQKEVEVFGPYPKAVLADALWRAGQEVLGLRTCSTGVYKRHERSGRPCILADIGRCAAPCVGRINNASQRENVVLFSKAAKGDIDPLLVEIKNQEEAAAKLRLYEKAARLRDLKISLADANEQSILAGFSKQDSDVWAVASGFGIRAVQLLAVRQGVLVQALCWGVEGKNTDEQGLQAAMVEHYAQNGVIVSKILLNVAPTQELSAQLKNYSKRALVVQQPKRGHGKKAVEIAVLNAEQAVVRFRAQRDKNPELRSEALSRLGEVLGIEAPWRIECFDISHHAGKNSYAGLTVLEDGLPQPKEYRLYKVSTGGDDYKAMREAVTRRAKAGNLPDLLIVDGGKGQLEAGKKALKAAGVSVPIVGLAKRFEEIWGDVGTILLDDTDPALHILQLARDEAHRFSRRAHRRAKTKQSTKLGIEVKGLGPARQKVLLGAYPTRAKLQNATLEDLQKILPEEVSLAVFNTLHPPTID